MFGLPFFRPPKPVAPRPQKVAQPGFDDSIPPGLSPKQILSEIVEEAIKLHGLSAARPAKLVRREGNQVMVLIELQGDTPEQDTMQMVDNMVAQNADAILRINTVSYWRSGDPQMSQDDLVGQAIRREITQMRRQSRCLTAT